MVSRLKRIGYKIANWYLLRKFEDASYHQSKDNPLHSQKNDGQANIPAVFIDPDTRNISIEFGELRKLEHVFLKVYHNKKIYSSMAKNGTFQLEFISLLSETTESPLGKAKKHTIIWKIPGTDFQINTSIIVFSQKNYVIFELNFPKGFLGCTTDSFESPSAAFPCFTNASPMGRLLAFKDNTFCPPTKRIESYISSPVCLYDDERNSVLFSTLNDFATNIITTSQKGAKDYRSAQFHIGLNGLINEVPQNYSLSSIFVFERGINRAFETWGNLLHDYYQLSDRKIDPHEDLMNSHLGYFTDNGAYYYYFPLNDETYDKTLIAVENYYTEQEPIPFAYYHLDSWWYQKVWFKKVFYERKKNGQNPAGCTLWEPDPDVWSMPVEELSRELNDKPLTAHNRWFNQNTPYNEDFEMIIEDKWAMPTDLRFWQHIMDTAKKYNIMIYEQDWMWNQFKHFTHLQNKIGTHHQWLADMAQAAAEKNIKIQYCMTTPAQAMEGVQFPAVINIRTTDDYQSWKDWKMYYYDYTQNALLMNALRHWPFLDVFFSGTHDDEYAQEPYPEIRALMSSLGGGPIAVGDPIGEVEPEIIFRMVRKDGLIYKPDLTVKAPDLMFIPHKCNYVSYTSNTHGDFTWYYVVNFSFYPDDIDKGYSLKDIDIKGKYVEYDWFSKKVKIVDDGAEIYYDPRKIEYRYCVYAPVLSNGIAILGDSTKYIMMNSTQFPNIKVEGDSLTLGLYNIKAEKTQLAFYAPKLPSKIEIDGNPLDSSDIEEDDNLFLISVDFSETKEKTVTIVA